jgi:hypothetical protein
VLERLPESVTARLKVASVAPQVALTFAVTSPFAAIARFEIVTPFEVTELAPLALCPFTVRVRVLALCSASLTTAINELVAAAPSSRVEFVTLVNVGAVLGLGSTVNEYVRLPPHPFKSVAVTVKMDVPIAVGVPLNVPFGASVKPAGNAPVNVKV